MYTTTYPFIVESMIILSLILTCHFQFTTAFSTKLPTNNVITLQPDGSANDVLCRLLNSNNTSTKHFVSLKGFVSKRRAIGKSLVFLDIIPSEVPLLEHHSGKNTFATNDYASIKPVQALLRRDVWKSATELDDGETAEQFDVYQKIIQPGVYCSLIGEAGPSRLQNEALLFCHAAIYELPNDNPQHLRNAIRFARKGYLDLDEISSAIPCIDYKELVLMLNNKDGVHLTNGECATEILSRFPRNFLLNPSHLMGNSNSAKVALLPPVPDEYRPPIALSNVSDHFSSTNISTINYVLENLQQPNSIACVPHQFTLSGWVQNRRRFQHSISVVEIVEQFSSSTEITEKISEIDMTLSTSQFSQAWSERIHAVMDPNVMGGIEISEMYGNVLAPGSKILVQGYLQRSEKSDIVICWVSSCRLLHSSWKLNAVRQLLDLLHENKIDIDEAADALKLEGGYGQAEKIASGTTTSTDRQWMAAEVSQSLQGEHSRYGKITSAMNESLTKCSELRDKYPIRTVAVESNKVSERLQSNSTSARVAPNTSRWERAKKPQLIWMIGQISEVLKSHPEYGHRVLKILDIGGGKGLLSNLLAETFADKVEVQVVDISISATNNGMMRARRRGIENVSYKAQDATTLNVEGIDVIVALHACGALSDVALGHACSQGSGFVICPW